MDAALVTSLLIFWITLVVLQCFVHHFMIEVLKSKPIYMQWLIIRGFVAICYGIAFDLFNLWEYAPIFTFQLASHFAIFNPSLNRLLSITRKQTFKFWALGKESGWFDQLFRGAPGLYKLTYFGSVAILILSSVVIYQRYVH